jgi:3-deoxy-manno-octulosonate cytidylyltransferase (CMP-KDO synthetase)
MDCLAIIPARYASSRFPGKLLATVAGRPLIEHVIELARRVPGIDHTVLATDDERIAEAARRCDADVVLSSDDFASGTDRVAATAARYPADVIVNIQGDELLLDTDAVGRAVERFRDARFGLGTLRARLTERQDLWDPNVVKVVIDDNERALYFSRAPVPFPRAHWQAALQRGESAAWPPASEEGPLPEAWLHLGVYLYRAEALRRWAELPSSRLENAEGLEQLRVLEAGEHMQTYLINEAVPGVNTPGDLSRAEAALASYAQGT